MILLTDYGSTFTEIFSINNHSRSNKSQKSGFRLLRHFQRLPRHHLPVTTGFYVNRRITQTRVDCLTVAGHFNHAYSVDNSRVAVNTYGLFQWINRFVRCLSIAKGLNECHLGIRTAVRVGVNQIAGKYLIQNGVVLAYLCSKTLLFGFNYGFLISRRNGFRDCSGCRGRNRNSRRGRLRPQQLARQDATESQNSFQARSW